MDNIDLSEFNISIVFENEVFVTPTLNEFKMDSKSSIKDFSEVNVKLQKITKFLKKHYELTDAHFKYINTTAFKDSGTSVLLNLPNSNRVVINMNDSIFNKASIKHINYNSQNNMLTVVAKLFIGKNGEIVAEYKHKIR